VTSFSMFYSYMKQMKSKTDLVHSKWSIYVNSTCMTSNIWASPPPAFKCGDGTCTPLCIGL
jgi:hypothetical protein